MERKICFISLDNIFLVPYFNNYKEILKNNEYDLIFWNKNINNERDGIEFDHRGNAYSFNYEISGNESKFYKLIGYFKFRKFIYKCLKKQKYDKVVLLQGQLAVFLADVLLKKYPKKYLVEIRDYFMEKNKIYYFIQKKVLKKSALSIISSEKFKEFLPKLNYLMMHNIVDFKNINLNYKKKSQITISNIGFIRFNEQNLKFINLFQGDSRFKIRFIGKGANNLKKLAQNKNYNLENIEFIDKFSPKETQRYIEETDLIFNLYGTYNPLVKYLLSNKLYYSAQFLKPILVSKNTAMEDISVKKYNFGFTFDMEKKNEKERLYDYYKNVDLKILEENCNNFLKEVKEKNKETILEIKNFLEK